MSHQNVTGPDLREEDWSLVPEHIRWGLSEYLRTGLIPGDFLQAVISNNLSEAMGRADSTNRERLFDIVRFFYQHVPSPAWGSKEKMIAWANAGGLEGRKDAEPTE